jgi:AcrR family transcriptional regulator
MEIRATVVLSFGGASGAATTLNEEVSMSAEDKERAVRGPYAKTAAVRRRIIDACFEVFTESGYRATTMKAVAERAGISQRGLVHHFRDKEELLAAVLEARDENTSSGHPELGAAGGLASLVRTHLETMTHPEVLELHTVLSGEAVSPTHPAHDYYLERYSNLRLYLAASFDSLRDQGRLRSTADSAVLASMVLGLMDGLQVQWLFDPASVDVEQALELFLSSIGAEPGNPGDPRKGVGEGASAR